MSSELALFCMNLTKGMMPAIAPKDAAIHDIAADTATTYCHSLVGTTRITSIESGARQSRATRSARLRRVRSSHDSSYATVHTGYRPEGVSARMLPDLVLVTPAAIKP
jgi:hypothetical protein